jgi:hypothetical protein
VREREIGGTNHSQLHQANLPSQPAPRNWMAVKSLYKQSECKIERGVTDYHQVFSANILLVVQRSSK